MTSVPPGAAASPSPATILVSSHRHFRAQVAPAYGDTWDQAIGDLCADPGERAVIDELRAALDRDGRFRDPVVVETDDDGTLRVANGMHRVTASVLAGRPVRWRFGWPAVHEQAEAVDVTFDVPGGLDDDTFDELTGVLRSFALDEDTWVETDSFSGHRNELSSSWYCPHDRSGDLVDALLARGAHHHLSVTSTTTTTY